MIYLKQNPKGIDIQIQRIQEYIYNKINEDYNCEVFAYGRVYENKINGVKKPLAYVGSGEYRDVLTDDRINGLHFFFVENEKSEVISRTCMSNNEVDVVFIIDDLSNVKQDITHYPDEEIKEDIKSYLRGFAEVVSVTKNEDALKGYDVENIPFIYPFFVFKITININNY